MNQLYKFTQIRINRLRKKIDKFESRLFFKVLVENDGTLCKYSHLMNEKYNFTWFLCDCLIPYVSNDEIVLRDYIYNLQKELDREIRKLYSETIEQYVTVCYSDKKVDCKGFECSHLYCECI